MAAIVCLVWLLLLLVITSASAVTTVAVATDALASVG